jgi:hypothetical protein
MWAALGAASLVSGCGNAASEPAVDAKPAVAKPKPLSQTDPEAFKKDPSTAMREVPPASRNDVQAAIICRVKRMKEAGQTAALDAQTIRTITESLASGRTVDEACAI